MPKPPNSKRILAIAAASLLVATLLVARAQSAAPNLVPYSGYLDNNGAPVTGKLPMTFFLVTQPQHTSAQAIWSEVHTEVDVLGGRFSVSLGGKTPIPEARLRDEAALYIGVKVGDVELSGKQRLLSSPYSLTSVSARDFTVTGSLSVAGAGNLAGALTVGGKATVNGNLAVGGSLLGNPAKVKTFSALSGTDSTGDTTAQTDGFVTAQLSAAVDGAGGYVRAFIGNEQVAVEHFHYYTGALNTDYVNSGSLSFLVKKGATWRVEANCLWLTCSGDVRWTSIGNPP